jgi:hypothetical protein
MSASYRKLKARLLETDAALTRARESNLRLALAAWSRKPHDAATCGCRLCVEIRSILGLKRQRTVKPCAMGVAS